jgi:hypothetical protein
MRLNHQGIYLWYGTSDAPAPMGTVAADSQVPITIGIQPADASNQVEVRYRVNGGSPSTVPARFYQSEPFRRIQYFRAYLPALRSGDQVEYTVLCRCAGRQVPAPEEAQSFQASFQVEGTQESSPAESPSAKLSPASPSVKPSSRRAVPPQPPRNAAISKPASFRESPESDSDQNLVVDEPIVTSSPEENTVTHTVKGLLIDQESGTPLIGYALRTDDLDAGAEPVDLGYSSTDKTGQFKITYTEPQPSRSDQKNRRLQLHILDADGDEIYQTQAKFTPNSAQGTVISVPTNPDISSPPLTEIASQAKLNLSPRLIQTLDRQGIRTLADIRKAGGLRNQKDLQIDPENTSVKTLDAHAKLSTLSPDIEINKTLIAKGFDNPLKIAQLPQTEFIAKTGKEIGEVEAVQLHAQAVAQKKVLNNILTGIRADLANGVKPATMVEINPAIFELLPELFNCSCKDCESAVSPLAYLADLLDYAIAHVKDDNKKIDLEWLKSNLHQPFGDLPVTCETLEEKVRQVRIAVEVLRSYLGQYASSSKPKTPSKPTTPDLPLGATTKGISQSANGSPSVKVPGNFSVKATTSGLSPMNVDSFKIEQPEPEPPPPNPDSGFADVYLDESIIAKYVQLYQAEKNYRVTAYKTLLNQIGTSYDELRLARTANAENRNFLAERIGIDSQHLYELLIDITDGAHPTEAELETLFGLPDTTQPPLAKNSEGELIEPAPAKLQTWRLEYLRSLWQQQDHPTTIYRQGKRPIIDPDLIGKDDLRKPLSKNPAFELWQQRRSQVDTYQQNLQTTLSQTNDSASLLQDSLGKSLAYLENQRAKLQTGEDIEDTTDNLLELGLTLERFTRLMQLQAKHQENAELEEREQQELIAILTQAYKVREKFPNWIEEEQNEQLILGTQHFVIAVEEPENLPLWLASTQQRQEWQEALHLNSQPPIIDPHLLDTKDFKSKSSVAYQLWQERKEWVDQLTQKLKPDTDQKDIIPFKGKESAKKSSTSKDNKGKPAANNSESLLKLETIIAKAGLEITLKQLDSLVKKRGKGEEITPRLQQLGLTNAAFTYLMRIRDMAVAYAPILKGEWEEVYAILIQVAKSRQFTQWREAERDAGITLSPDYFVIRETDEPLSLPKWLTTRQNRRDWEDKLQARIDQENNVIQALKTAVSSTEEATLYMLRDALIQFTNAKGNTLEAKAKWLSDRLLIDFQVNGCQVTTRVSQAIETLQSLIWSIRTGQLQDSYPKLKLIDTANFEEEWKWLGSYANWRAAMFVFLYPENILIPTLRKRQTPGFCQLVNTIRRKQPLTPEEAQDAANQYTEYFRDVCNMTVQASCLVKTKTYQEDGCQFIEAGFSVRMHIYALSKNNGKVYTSSYNAQQHDDDTQNSWKEVPNLNNVQKIIGAVPHNTPSKRRFILLFVKIKQGGIEEKLGFMRFDVETARWNGFIDLSLQAVTENRFSAIAIQKKNSSTSFPTLLAIRASNGIIFLRKVNDEATDWSERNWFPLFGVHLTKDVVELWTMLQRKDNEYVIFFKRRGVPKNILSYRILHIGSYGQYMSKQGKDDGQWQDVVNQDGSPYNFDNFAGSLTGLGSSADSLVFTQKKYISANKTFYFTLSKTGSFYSSNERKIFFDGLEREDYRKDEGGIPQLVQGITQFNNNWLRKYVGLSLSDFKFNDLDFNFHVPKSLIYHHLYKDDWNWNQNPVNPDWENHSDDFNFSGFTGNLLELLTMNSQERTWLKLNNFQFGDPDGDSFKVSPIYYYIQLLAKAVREFCQALENIDDIDFIDPIFGHWKLANLYVKNFSEEQLSLSKVVSIFARNRINDLAKFLADHQVFDYDYGVLIPRKVFFRNRNSQEEIKSNENFRLEIEGSLINAVIIPSSGGGIRIDCETTKPGIGPVKAGLIPPDCKLQKTNLLSTSTGVFRCRLELSNDRLVLIPESFRRVKPHGIKYFDVSPYDTTSNLESRKNNIKDSFDFNIGSPNSILNYLEEAYYSVPIYIAIQLQRSYYYTSALDWFRVVYDYSTSDENRNIYAGFTLGSTVNLSKFDRTEDWLLDPLNPHAIARLRGLSVITLRYTLISLVRCFLEYADAEFSRDTAESVARARTLYTTALELLDLPELQQNKGFCQDLIGSITFDIGDETLKSVTQKELSKINTPKLIQAIANDIKGIVKENISGEEKSQKIKTLVERYQTPNTKPKTINSVVQTKSDSAEELSSLVLANPTIAKAAIPKKESAFVQTLVNRSNSNPATQQFLASELSQPKSIERTVENNSFKQVTLDEEPPIPPTKPVILEVFPFDETDTDDGISVGGFTDFEYSPELSVEFCILPNPILAALRQRAELALYKIRNCLNIAGMRRELSPYAAPTDTVTGLPTIGSSDQLILPGANLNPAQVALKPTLYRYSVLIERAKQLVGLAAQIEASMLSAIEKRDNEAYTLLKARQDAEMARAGVRLQDLRVREAVSSISLAVLQQERSQIQVNHFEGLLNEGNLQQEEDALKLMKQSSNLQAASAAMSFAAAATYQIAAGVVGIPLSVKSPTESIANALSLQASAFSATASGLSSTAGVLSTKASILSTKASYERRRQDWQFQMNLSEQDVLIGEQQIQIAQNRAQVVRYERAISEMQVQQAAETIEFLTNKFTNVALYDWMSSVLESVYSYFLQQATSMAKLAETQLGFERQETPPALIQSDYWEAPNNNSDRRGLTGSARLLEDIHKLDQYAFETDQRKLQLTKTISLAQSAPIEFQRFRETGILIFATPMELFDRDFPGHYLRLVKRIRTTVIALIPPNEGIKATLSTTGTSRVVIGGDIFQTVTINRGPESVALSSPFNETGVFELQEQPEMLLPFEKMGVDSTWEFRMPKASNRFDYETIADVLITIEYTALNSYDYRHQIAQKLDTRISGDRPFSFRNELADQWYDLNNPDQTNTPMVVRFSTRREDFPPNIDHLKIQQIILYFVRQDGADFEVPVTHLHFTEQNGVGTVGGGSSSIDGIISTRRGNAGSWLAMIGKSPFGEWELAFPDAPSTEPRPRELFENEEIEDILFVITYSGYTPKWPV